MNWLEGGGIHVSQGMRISLQVSIEDSVESMTYHRRGNHKGAHLEFQKTLKQFVHPLNDDINVYR